MLTELGWSPHWQALFEPHVAAGLTPARVIRSDRGSLLGATQDGVVRAKPSVRLLKATPDPSYLPIVGDWIGMLSSEDRDMRLIDAVLERRSAITRGESGRSSGTQVLAANIDTVFVVQPIAEPPNLRRIERELSLAWDSRAAPVVVLTKTDLSPDPDRSLAAVESIALGVDVLRINALDGDSARQLLTHFSNHRSAVLIGPSGAGKSTLINALLGEQRQETRDVRVSDGRGRHTTVARELIRIAGHGVIIDTPGLRALGLTGSEQGISSAFPDIERYALSCRFQDCSHSNEPDCAVRSVVESGALQSERLVSYQKLLREAQLSAMKTDARLRAAEHRKGRVFSKAVRSFYKITGRRKGE